MSANVGSKLSGRGRVSGVPTAMRCLVVTRLSPARWQQQSQTSEKKVWHPASVLYYCRLFQPILQYRNISYSVVRRAIFSRFRESYLGATRQIMATTIARLPSLERSDSSRSNRAAPSLQKLSGLAAGDISTVRKHDLSTTTY